MTTRSVSIIALLALSLDVAAGCGSESRGGDVDADSDSDSDGDSDGDTDGDSDGDSDDGCSEESKLIYVVDLDDSLYRFDPEADSPTEAFEPVGTIDCPSTGSPYALGMTRDDVVYVLYTGASGCEIFAVSTTDASCLGDTGFPCSDAIFPAFGMGSATDGPDSTEDTLYIGSETQLASLDTATWEITYIGAVESTPDMSGNGNGDLFAFFAWTSPPRFSRLDKTDASEHDTVQLPQLAGVGAFAFATWGGDGWIFDDAGGSSTSVYRLHDGQLTTHLANTGLTIVGADTSTCAPYVIE
jgi:hypothetical protein